MKMVDAKTLAQKIAFAPFTFQAIRALINFGILKVIDDASLEGISIDEICKETKVSNYCVETLIEAALAMDILIQKKDKIYTTKIAQCFLYDKMTNVNMDFINDVCYQGSFYLQQSFLKGKPEGLKVFGKWATVYEALPALPENVQKSWLAFDHFYSSDAFNDAIKIILSKNPKMIFDIGANTGKFEKALLASGYKGEIVLIDLPAQLAKAKENLKGQGFGEIEFYPINILDQTSVLPKNPDIIFMSQFLDCFSKEEIVLILKKACAVMTAESKLFILEPFWDKQKYEAAKISLTHLSLYFTAIANGNSKMYKQADICQCIKKSGLKKVKTYNNIGSYEYSLIECSQ
jgi:hypothetical protein